MTFSNIENAFLNFQLSGDNCETNFNECESNPCQNNGTCIDMTNGYLCSCIPGFAGDHCEVDIAVCNSSEEVRCYNGGQCIEGPGFKFYCKCPPGENLIYDHLAIVFYCCTNSEVPIGLFRDTFLILLYFSKVGQGKNARTLWMNVNQIRAKMVESVSTHMRTICALALLVCIKYIIINFESLLITYLSIELHIKTFSLFDYRFHRKKLRSDDRILR